MSESLLLPDTGELNRRIVIYRWTDAPNINFNIDALFDAAISRWAKVEPIRGIASRMGVTTAEEPTHYFWVRYSAETTADFFSQDRVIEYHRHRYRILDAQNFQDADLFIRITTKDLGAIDAMVLGAPIA
ncbi:phage head completion protein [Xanthomonas albilineans]|uniref:phage head completion protein n=2 Tax=Xanthomonas albilineans TaxID=29447 RepID=UPI0005F342A4|nr:head-tail adaptor protein [Xanthomonas albilineans]PPU93744.1 head-tail adaptor protein [Xanthomonas albilineans]